MSLCPFLVFLKYLILFFLLCFFPSLLLVTGANLMASSSGMDMAVEELCDKYKDFEIGEEEGLIVDDEGLDGPKWDLR